MRPRLGAPFDVSLPSGGKVRLVARSLADAPRDLAGAIARGAVKSETKLDWNAMALADANVIEAVLAAVGVIHAEPADVDCRNCGERVQIDAAKFLPIAPLLEPQNDPELDRPVDRDEEHPFDAPIDLGRRGTVTAFRLARRTFGDRLRVEAMLGPADAPLPLDGPFVRALGLVSLGSITSATAIARVLRNVDDATFDRLWDQVARAWDEQHWPRRLLAPSPCPKCAARHDLEVLPRPISFGSAARPATAGEEFPDLSRFRAISTRITREVLAEQSLEDARGLEVIVDDGVPACDDGGEPLLGSYVPAPEADGDVRLAQSSPFVITLYYRTFRSMFEDEPYDVEAEIRETIAHELEHHVNFLSGDDPLDDEERAEIVREKRRLHGTKAGDELAASVGWLAGDVGKFFRLTWPIWLLVGIGTLLLIVFER